MLSHPAVTGGLGNQLEAESVLKVHYEAELDSVVEYCEPSAAGRIESLLEVSWRRCGENQGVRRDRRGWSSGVLVGPR